MESGIRNETKCSVLAVYRTDGTSFINPDASHVFEMGDVMYLIGDNAAQKLFGDVYGIDKETMPDAGYTAPEWNKISDSEKTE
ncbi:MAG: TrkA C-terminal domain-containing protein [Desulfovibrionaceae bacterium]|nr:TrkA C-terminal domain-containing protein [Desulfovibrionaceae bacterium]